MQQHLCECFIDIAGEKTQVLWKGEPDLVPWPEIRVLLDVHGEQSVYNIRPIALGPRENQTREKERLVRKYGREAVENVYAGKSFNMEWFVPGWPIDPSKHTKARDKALAAKPPIKQVAEPGDDEDLRV